MRCFLGAERPHAERGRELKIFEGRRDKVAVVDGPYDRAGLGDVVAESKARAPEIFRQDDARAVVANPGVDRKVVEQRELVLDVETTLPAVPPTPEVELRDGGLAVNNGPGGESRNSGGPCRARPA